MTTLSLQDCLEAVIDNRGVTPGKRGTQWKTSGIRVLSANNVKTTGLQNLQDARFINEAVYDSWMKFPLERGDILLTSEAPAGEVYYWDSDEKVVLGQRLYGLKVKKGINSLYLKYYLQSARGQKEIRRFQSGSTVFGISAATFPHICVKLPKLEAQDAIARILHSIDQKIDNNLSIIEEVEALIVCIFNYWFLQFDFPNKEGEPYRSSGGKMVWNEELKRKIPDGWEVRALEKSIRLQRGVSYSSKEITEKSGTAMINLASIGRQRSYRASGIKWYSGTVSSKHILRGGEMLIACTDLTRNADIIGCPILVPHDSQPYTFSMDLVRLLVEDTTLDDMFLYMALRTTKYHNYIKYFASGTNVLHLNTDAIGWYSVCIPPMHLQKRIGDMVREAHRLISVLMTENEHLSSLRDWLLPMMINGQVRVK